MNSSGQRFDMHRHIFMKGGARQGIAMGARRQPVDLRSHRRAVAVALAIAMRQRRRAATQVVVEFDRNLQFTGGGATFGPRAIGQAQRPRIRRMQAQAASD